MTNDVDILVLLAPGGVALCIPCGTRAPLRATTNTWRATLEHNLDMSNRTNQQGFKPAPKFPTAKRRDWAPRTRVVIPQTGVADT